jgi:pantothenate kinase type III
MIDGRIERIREELKLPRGASLPIVATGGHADLVLPACTHAVSVEPHLTLLGLYFIFKATAEREAKKKG